MLIRPPWSREFWLTAAVFAALWGVVVYRIGPPFWSSYPDYSFGWSVPLLCLYLLWERWKSQGTEDRGRRTEDGGRRIEDRGRRTEDGGRRTEDGGRRTEDGGRSTEDGGRRTEDRAERGALTPAPTGGEGDVSFTGNAATRILPAKKDGRSELTSVLRPLISMLDVRCWMFDVRLSRRRSSVLRPPSSVRRLALAVVVVLALSLLPAFLIQEANLIWISMSWVLTLQALGITFCLLFLAGGWNWLNHFWFPFFFFLTAIHWGPIEAPLIAVMSRLNAAAALEALGLWGIPAVQHGNVLEISTGMVGIDEACSGIRSLHAVLMIALFFGELYRFTAMRRATLLFAGVALAFVCNVLRTFTLTVVCARQGMTAMEQWHDPTGVSILVACFTGLWLISVAMAGRQRTEDGRQRTEDGGQRTEDGRQRTEDGRQRTEDGRQRTEDGRQRTEDGGQRTESSYRLSVISNQRTEDSGQRSVVRGPWSGDRGRRTEDGGRRTEDGGQRTEDGGQRTEDGGQRMEDRRRRTEDGGRGEQYISLPALPLSLSIGLLVWLAVVEVAVEGWYRAHEVQRPAVAAWTARFPIDQRQSREVNISPTVQENLKFDEGRSVAWEAPDGTSWHAYYFRWNPPATRTRRAWVQRAMGHHPERCLTGTGMTLTSDAGTRLFRAHGFTLPFRVFEFLSDGRPVHVFHCIWHDGTPPTIDENAKETATTVPRLTSVFTGNRNRDRGVRSMEVAIWGYSDLPHAEAALRRQLERIVEGEKPL